MPDSTYFKDVTLLITHYNRSLSLKRLLDSFKALNCNFEHIIVSDDCSKPEHLEKLRDWQSEYHFELISTKKNKGLANNLNKGQDAVKTSYTLYVQEDFVPKILFPEKLSQAVCFMNEKSELDIVRFYAYFKYPYLKPFRDGFSEMIFSIFKTGYKKFYFYSDHPHLRRSTFLQKFGRYIEGINSDQAEYKMMMTFLKRKGTGLFYVCFTELFDQLNSDEEPSTVHRNNLRESNNFFIKTARHLYRHLKFNFDFIR